MKYHNILLNSLNRSKLISILVVLYILVFFNACPRGPVAEEEITIQFNGTVTDESTGLPIAGANVQVYAYRINKVYQSTKTDQEGQYNMEYSGPFKYKNPLSDVGGSQPVELRAVAEGYTSDFEQINTTDSFQTINFVLTPLD